MQLWAVVVDVVSLAGHDSLAEEALGRSSMAEVASHIGCAKVEVEVGYSCSAAAHSFQTVADTFATEIVGCRNRIVQVAADCSHCSPDSEMAAAAPDSDTLDLAVSHIDQVPAAAEEGQAYCSWRSSKRYGF